MRYFEDGQWEQRMALDSPLKEPSVESNTSQFNRLAVPGDKHGPSSFLRNFLNKM